MALPWREIPIVTSRMIVSKLKTFSFSFMFLHHVDGVIYINIKIDEQLLSSYKVRVKLRPCMKLGDRYASYGI